MERHFKIIKVIVFSLFWVSCSSDIIELPKAELLTGTDLPEIEVLTNHNVRLTVVDTFLIIQKREESIVQVFSTKTHNKLLEFGKAGRGPNEFIRPSLMKQTSVSSKNYSPIIKIYDFQRKKLMEVNLLSAISGEEIPPLMTVPGDNFLPYLHFINDEFYLASPDSREFRFVLRDLKKGSEIRIPFIPELPFDVPKSAIGVIFSANATVVNLEKEMFVTAPMLLGELNFFNLKGQLIKSVVFQDREKFKDELSQGTGAVNKTKYQIAQFDSDEDHLYALNYNSSISDFNKGVAEPQIQVFDWNGNPKKVFSLGAEMITSFALDKENKRIYTYSPSNEKSPIAYFNLK